MKTGKILMALPILASLYSCQSETPHEIDSVGRIFTVRATLPDSENTRTHITYGNTDIDKEEFRWHEITDVYNDNDFISVFNVTRLSENPYGVELNAVEVNGNSAIFESPEIVDSSFTIKAGDTIFVNYYNTRTNRTTDGQYVFTIDVGTESNKPQYIGVNPVDSMSYMQGNLKMYDIVTAVKDDKIPDIHFKHLSAILRVSLRNETGKYIYPTKLEFKYPGTESFFNTTLYCSVDTTQPSGLKVFTNKEFFGSSEAYTDKIGTTINGKENTADAGDSIAPGQTYDLYLSTVPRIDNEQIGNSLTIDLIQKHDTDHPYRITLDGFNVPIKAGKRYWFNLTAVTENDTINKLMLTSKWLETHPDAKPYYK